MCALFPGEQEYQDAPYWHRHGAMTRGAWFKGYVGQGKHQQQKNGSLTPNKQAPSCKDFFLWGSWKCLKFHHSPSRFHAK